MAGNIFSFVTGILPKKKNDGFYLQLDETGNVVEPAKEATAKKPEESTNGTKPVEASAQKPAAQSKKTSIKAAKAESSNGKAPSSEVATPAVAPAPAPAVAPQQPAETNFATKYLLSTSTNGRRRPGANMSSYLDMARQAKTPKN